MRDEERRLHARAAEVLDLLGLSPRAHVQAAALPYG